MHNAFEIASRSRVNRVTRPSLGEITTTLAGSQK
jgi:hypothetical protein